MRNYNFLVVAALSMGLASCNYSERRFVSPGYSQFSETKTTFQNTPVQLKFLSDLNPDCSFRGYPVQNILEQPRNGTLKISNIHDYTNYITFVTQAQCNKKKNPGSEVRYIPYAGFYGADSAVVETIFSNGTVVRHRYNIVVRP